MSERELARAARRSLTITSLMPVLRGEPHLQSAGA
jgi:hypothetical protein